MKTTGPKDFAAFLRAFATQLAIDLGSKHIPSAALLREYAEELDPLPTVPVEVTTAELTPADVESAKREEKPHGKRK